jgi:hypothetical protein
MDLHGKELIAALIHLLDNKETSVDVKEQAMCNLANIASGETAREYIMADEVLHQLIYHLKDDNVKLQIAATYCISNLAWFEDEGAYERQMRLRELDIHKILQDLLDTTDTTLFDKVKTALQQFRQ